MYIVLTAMLALNVSSDVLDGFVQVEDGLARTNVNVIERNDALYGLKGLRLTIPRKVPAGLTRLRMCVAVPVSSTVMSIL